MKIPFITILYDYWDDDDGGYKTVAGIEVEYVKDIYFPHYLDDTIN